VNSTPHQRLSDFILEQLEPILAAWEEFARTMEPQALEMDSGELRDHAAEMLRVIAADLKTPQSAFEQAEKSKGRGRRSTEDTPAETHAVQRLESGFTIEQLVSEYRALRASVLKLWAATVRSSFSTDPEDITRFNEAIDQALAESVARFAKISKELNENERRRLNAVLEAAPVGIALADTNGQLILDNAENRHIWGERPIPGSVAEYGDWKGWWADGSDRHGRKLEPHEWPLARTLAGETTPHDIIEIEPFGSSGQRRTIVLHAAPILDGRERITGGIVAQMDITGQVRAEAALRESEAKFRTIANAMPQMVWSTLPNGLHDYFNHQWYEYTGVAVGSTDGEGWNDVFHAEDRPIAWERWQHSLATGETYEIQYRLRHRSGQYRWVLGRALPVRDESGKITRWMGTCTDIHDQKLAEERLKESSERKDEFLAMLAHELRNPLAPISSAAQLLNLAGQNEKMIKQSSEIIARQVKHMTNLVDDLLDVSRVTRGLVELDKEDLDLKLVINSAVEQIRPMIESRHHQLHLRLPLSHAYVHGDKTRLVQILANILGNAAKYTPSHGEIELELEVQQTQVQIRVRDNGSGISPSLLSHIFDLFTQAHRTPDRSQGGLGLGLALVKSLTGLHGGSVSANSPGIGKGSTFVVTLPLITPQVAMANERDRGRHPEAVPAIRAKYVTIVDDNADAAHSLAYLLQAAGHFVTVHEHPAKAIAEAEMDPKQVYILDIGLPDMDGYALARRLRAIPGTSHAILIALTGYGQAHDRVLSKSAGFDHHFVKPIDPHELAAILDRVR
jgi:PAS domain S-box-containing protein